MRIIELLEPKEKCHCGCANGNHKMYYGKWRISGCKKHNKICRLDTQNSSKEEAKNLADLMSKYKIEWNYADFDTIVEFIKDD